MTISQRTTGDVTILDLQGKLTLGDGTEVLREAVNTLVAAGSKKFVLHLSGVPFVDSAGLGEIVRTANNAKKVGGGAVLANPTQRIIDLLRIAKVQSFIDTYPSETEAVASFSK